jgi:hypothetical protein
MVRLCRGGGEENTVTRSKGRIKKGKERHSEEADRKGREEKNKETNIIMKARKLYESATVPLKKSGNLTFLF